MKSQVRETTAVSSIFLLPVTRAPQNELWRVRSIKGNAAKGRREDEAQRGKRVKGKKALANRHGLFYPWRVWFILATQQPFTVMQFSSLFLFPPPTPRPLTPPPPPPPPPPALFRDRLFKTPALPSLKLRLAAPKFSLDWRIFPLFKRKRKNVPCDYLSLLSINCGKDNKVYSLTWDDIRHREYR